MALAVQLKSLPAEPSANLVTRALLITTASIFGVRMSVRSGATSEFRERSDLGIQ
jgi:hypothetical protein